MFVFLLLLQGIFLRLEVLKHLAKGQKLFQDCITAEAAEEERKAKAEAEEKMAALVGDCATKFALPRSI
jgi:hypothetical protein